LPSAMVYVPPSVCIGAVVFQVVFLGGGGTLKVEPNGKSRF
jgi:hypothetical protein